MTGRQTKRSCPFCQSSDRDDLEKQLISGDISPGLLDQEQGWRPNTSDRHFRNHMGEYVVGANPQCTICSSDNRSEFENSYFSKERTLDDIAAEAGCTEQAVYNHMKKHFQPIVKRSAASLAVVKVGEELGLLRNNVSKLNNKLDQLMDDGSVHADGFVRDVTSLHKEVRESLKDLSKFHEDWGGGDLKTGQKVVADTINILKVELSQESPETWVRVRERLMNQSDEIVVEGV